MYAIVKIAGKQFKVEKDKYIYTHRLANEVGASVELSDVYLVDNNGKVQIGTPTVKGAKVTAKVLEHAQGDKVIVFKKKRRKGYKKTHGHRQDVTKLQIEAISA
jgi:large subunit ribosomal protein L21